MIMTIMTMIVAHGLFTTAISHVQSPQVAWVRCLSSLPWLLKVGDDHFKDDHFKNDHDHDADSFKDGEPTQLMTKTSFPLL